MYNGIFTACDCCATILDGKKGTADINKDHLILKGNIGLYVADSKHKSEWSDSYIYWAKKKDDFGQLDFCNAECLQGYIDAKRVLIDQSKDARLNNDTY